MPQNKVSFYSVRHANNRVSPLSFDVLGQLARGAREIEIFSAFFDAEFFKQLGGFVRPRTTFKLYLNVSCGHRRDEDCALLKEIESDLRADGHRVQVRVFDKSRLYHMKVMRFVSADDVSYILGSPNATKPAFTTNEELAILLRGRRADLDGYLDELRSVAARMSEAEDLIHTSLHELLRDGAIWYRPKITKHFSFPLIEEELYDRVYPRENPGTIPAHKELGIGGDGNRSYDVLRKFKDRPSGGRTTPLAIKVFCVETCYGLWAPSSYTEAIEQRVRVKGGARNDASERFRAKFRREYRSRKLLKSGVEVLNTIDGDVRQARATRDWSIADKTKQLERFLERCSRNVESDSWFRALCSGFAPRVVPEIWDDPIASTDFIDDFFDDLATRGRHSLVKRSFMTRIESTWPNAQGTLADNLPRFIQQFGWCSRDWIQPKR